MDFDTHADLMTRVEALHDDLKPYVFQHKRFKGLNHPLVQAIPLFDIERCAMLNAQYAYKQEALKKAEAKRDFMTFIMLHERPYRFDALSEVTTRFVTTDKEFAPLVAAVWTDSENIWQNQDRWRFIWGSMNNPHLVMDELERAAYGSMPPVVTVFRGLTAKSRNRNGLSWTTSYDKAKWFARRFNAPNPVVITGEIDKPHIYAYFAGRNESEVVLNVSRVRNKRMEAVT